jgi:hypothetical protein
MSVPKQRAHLNVRILFTGLLLPLTVADFHRKIILFLVGLNS